MAKHFPRDPHRTHKPSKHRDYEDDEDRGHKPTYSLDEGIHDLYTLIDKINKQTDVIIDDIQYNDSDSEDNIDAGIDSEYIPFSDPELPRNSRITQYIGKYRESLTRLTSENRQLRRQITSMKYHLTTDLTQIYEKLQNVHRIQNSEHDK